MAAHAEDIEDFGRDLFDRIVGGVEVADLVFAEQRFDLGDFHAALAQGGVTAVFAPLFTDRRQASGSMVRPNNLC